MADDTEPKPKSAPAVTFQPTDDPDWVLVLVPHYRGAYLPRLPIWKPIPNTESSISSAAMSVVRSQGAWLN